MPNDAKYLYVVTMDVEQRMRHYSTRYTIANISLLS